MGLGGISIWQLLIILLIVVLVFGTKRLKGIGGDLGGAIRGFKKAVSDGEDESTDKASSDKEGNDKEGTDKKSDTARVEKGEGEEDETTTSTSGDADKRKDSEPR